MDKYSKTAYFHLPFNFSYLKLYEKVLELYETKRELFKDNVKIGSFYGSPNGAIWNGGRMFSGNIIKKQLEEVRDWLYSYNIPFRFTFTNCLIEEKHLNDTYCNNILDIFNNGKNEVLCNVELLEKYIRNKYGNGYKYISSTTKRLTDKKEQQKEIAKDYSLVVLDYDFNKDFDFLKTIKERNKCEILCNAVCISNCPNRVKHYENISRCQLLNDTDDLLECSETGKRFWQIQENKNFISNKNIDRYLQMGFENFKLEGRTAHPLDLVEIFVYYLFKDSKAGIVREILQEVVW